MFPCHPIGEERPRKVTVIMFRKRGKQSVRGGRRHVLKRMCVVLILLSSPVAMTGCYDRQELEQQAFVSTLGIDKGPNGLIDCTLRISVPVNPSGAGAKGGMEPLASTKPVTVRAHSINEAMVLAGGSIERTITFSHLTLIIFGNELARDGVLTYIQPLIRYQQFRRSVLMSISKTTALDVIQADKPMLDTSIVRVADGMAMVGERSGIIPVCRLHDLASALENPHQSVIAPLYNINDFVKNDDATLPDNDKISYEAGKVLRLGGNPVEWMGAAVFKGDKVVDYLNGEDCIYIRMLEGGLYHAKLDLDDPSETGQDISVSLHKERAPQYKISLTNPVQIHVNLPVDVDVDNVASGIDYAQAGKRPILEKGLSEQVDQKLHQVLERLLVKDKTDVVPVSKYIRGKFRTYQQFADYPWDEQMKDAKIVVNADVHVRRFGVQMDPLRKLDQD